MRPQILLLRLVPKASTFHHHGSFNDGLCILKRREKPPISSSRREHHSHGYDIPGSNARSASAESNCQKYRERSSLPQKPPLEGCGSEGIVRAVERKQPLHATHLVHSTFHFRLRQPGLAPGCAVTIVGIFRCLRRHLGALGLRLVASPEKGTRRSRRALTRHPTGSIV